MLQYHLERAILMEREKLLCKLAKVRKTGVDLNFVGGGLLLLTTALSLYIKQANNFAHYIH